MTKAADFAIMCRRLLVGKCRRYDCVTGCSGRERRCMHKWMHHQVQKQQQRKPGSGSFHSRSSHLSMPELLKFQENKLCTGDANETTTTNQLII